MNNEQSTDASVPESSAMATYRLKTEMAMMRIKLPRHSSRCRLASRACDSGVRGPLAEEVDDAACAGRGGPASGMPMRRLEGSDTSR